MQFSLPETKYLPLPSKGASRAATIDDINNYYNAYQNINPRYDKVFCDNICQIEARFYQNNCPIWLLEKKDYQTFDYSNIDIERSLVDIKMPFDSMCISFERYSWLRGVIDVPIRCFMVAKAGNRYLIDWQYYKGRTLCGFDKNCFEDYEYYMPDGIHAKKGYKVNIKPLLHIFLYALRHWHSRPDDFKPYQLSKDELRRYSPMGPNTNIKQLTHKMAVLEDDPSPDTTSENGTRKKPHHRAGALRVLRDERFARNPDGSPKVIWVPATAIHSGKRRETK